MSVNEDQAEPCWRIEETAPHVENCRSWRQEVDGDVPKVKRRPQVKEDRVPK